MCMVAADAVALSVIYWLAVFGRYFVGAEYSLNFYLASFPLVSLFFIAFWAQGLYPGLLIHPAEEIRRIFYGLTVVFLLFAASTFLWKSGVEYSRSIFLAMWALGFPLVLLGRYIVRQMFSNKDWWGIPAVILGSGVATQRVVRSLRRVRPGLRIAGVLTEEPVHSWGSDLPPILGHLSLAPQIAARSKINYAIVVLPHHPSTDLRHLIEECCRGFRQILLVPNLPGICSLGISARDIGGEVGFEVPQRLFQQSAAIIKRTLDTAACIVTLLALSPLFALIAVCIKFRHTGSIFYGQNRYGRDGRIFKALKFRTMVPNADQVLENYLHSHPESRAEWQRDHKLKNDPRVTGLGKWLRRYSLDELPQLWNVVRGDMSLVGPRPIVEAEIRKYGRGYNLYARVRPGITGLWQVSGRNNTSYEERVAYDEYYVRNWSIWLDTYILLRTIRVVLTADGAY